MRIVCFQHERYEGPGIVASWCEFHEHELSMIKLFAGESPPPAEEVDFLVLMGGSMGAHDDQRHPWLKQEKKYLEEYARAKKPLLGICLGAQLLAAVWGARVYPNREKEIGWFPITLADEGRESRLFSVCPDSFPVFHWHGDTFDLPAGARRLASSSATAEQAFLLEDRILALQFHLEIDEPLLNAFIESGKNELLPGRFIQSAEELRRGLCFIPEVNRYMRHVLEAL